MDILTPAEKDFLAKNEMMEFYKTLARARAGAIRRIQRDIASGANVASVKQTLTQMTNLLQTNMSKLTDGNDDSCGAGRHWDEALGACVPD